MSKQALRIAGKILEVKEEAQNDIYQSLSLIPEKNTESFIYDFEKSIHGKGSRGFEIHLKNVLKQVPKWAKVSVTEQLYSKYIIIEIIHTFDLSGKKVKKIWYVGFDQIDDILSFIKKYHEKSPPNN